MASPFPGMDPYLEQPGVWHDFHERFCPAVAELLTAQVRPNFIVRIDEQVYIHELPEESGRFLGRADVGVSEPQLGAARQSGTLTLPAPSEVRLPGVDVERLSFVEVRDRETERVVAVIELLSPSNKQPGPDRQQYLAKRAALLNSAVHFVEIDLLRGGPRLPLEDLPPCDYYCLVSRFEDRPRAGLWPIGLRDPLPEVPVPLLDPHPDARLHLGQAVARVYDAAGYEDYIYRHAPQPPLAADDAAWAEEILAKR